MSNDSDPSIQVSQPIQLSDQRGPSSPSPQDLGSFSQPRRSKRPVVAAAFIAILIIAILIGAAITSGQQPRRVQAHDDVFLGAEIDYNITCNLGGYLSNGSMTMKVIKVTSDGYLMQWNITGVPWRTNESIWSSFHETSECVNETPSLFSDFKDRENISTIVGIERVDHYEGYDPVHQLSYDYYVIPKTGLWMEIDEIASNGSWAKYTFLSTNMPSLIS